MNPTPTNQSAALKAAEECASSFTSVNRDWFIRQFTTIITRHLAARDKETLRVVEEVIQILKPYDYVKHCYEALTALQQLKKELSE